MCGQARRTASALVKFSDPLSSIYGLFSVIFPINYLTCHLPYMAYLVLHPYQDPGNMNSVILAQARPTILLSHTVLVFNMVDGDCNTVPYVIVRC